MSKKIKGLGSQGVETSFDLEPKHPNSSKIPMIFFRKQIYLENAELTDAVFGTPPYKAYIQKDLRGRLKFFSKITSTPKNFQFFYTDTRSTSLYYTEII